jgi:hypothetical protein
MIAEPTVVENLCCRSNFPVDVFPEQSLQLRQLMSNSFLKCEHEVVNYGKASRGCNRGKVLYIVVEWWSGGVVKS